MMTKKNSDVVVEKRDESETGWKKKSGLDKKFVEVRTKSSAVRKDQLLAEHF